MCRRWTEARLIAEFVAQLLNLVHVCLNIFDNHLGGGAAVPDIFVEVEGEVDGVACFEVGVDG